MPYTLPVMIHVAAGGVGILSGAAALTFRKGERLHRLAGTIFFLSMLTMAGMAAAMAFLGGQKLNTLMGVFTVYLVSTAWAVVRRPEGVIGRFEVIAFLVALAAALAALAIGWQGTQGGGQMADGDPSSGSSAAGYFIVSGLIGAAAAMDLSMILRRGVSGRHRITRHLWRMCAALFIAAGSFFLGQADEIPEALRGPHLYVPPFAGIGAMVFWLLRVRFTNWLAPDVRPPARSAPA